MTPSPDPKIAAVLVAGGVGGRALSADGAGTAKQYRPVGGRPLIRWALDPFLSHPRITTVQPVVHRDHIETFAAIAPASGKLRPAVVGGASRQASTLAGLDALADEAPDIVLIHDAARPFVRHAMIDAVIAAIESGMDGAAPGHAVSDTLRRVGDIAAGTRALGDPVARDGLLALQTPQGFRFDKILAAHRAAADGVDMATDDTTLASAYGLDVVAVPGSADNFKVTFPEDFDRMDTVLAASRHHETYETRVGQGFDVHRLGPGTEITLCGVILPHDHALIGHSDADVGLHALTDAIFGALADGDIGAHFPPSDPKWRGAASDQFLAFARDRVVERGGAIIHADVTLICERPKIGPHRDAMRARIGEILGIEAGRVGVKATTSERLGFPGRGEGIACQAVATIRLPVEDD